MEIISLKKTRKAGLDFTKWCWNCHNATAPDAQAGWWKCPSCGATYTILPNVSGLPVRRALAADSKLFNLYWKKIRKEGKKK